MAGVRWDRMANLRRCGRIQLTLCPVDEQTPEHLSGLRRAHWARPITDDVSFGFTVRRCVRVGKSEGRLLEDLGIEPDVLYRPTLRDAMDRNRDLLTRATLELSQMPSYEFSVDIGPSPGEDVCLLLCRSSGLSAIEAYDGERFIAQGRPSDGGTLELAIPGPVLRVTLKGWAEDRLVARRIVATT